MSFRRSKPYWLVAAVGALGLAASGCVGEILSGAGGGDDATDGADDNGDGLGDGGGDGNGPPPVIEPGKECTDERPGPRQLRLLTRAEYKNTMRDLLGIEVSTDTLPGETRVNGFDNNASAMGVTGRHMDEYLALAEAASERALTEQRGKILSCSESEPGCARTFVTEFGEKAFRRPLTGDEIDDFASAFDGQSFEDGLRIATASILISPSFLYRWEIGETEGSRARLTPYETATALSYLFWGTMPDEQLFEAARNNQLGTSEEIEAQARRLLADPRARVQVANFAGQWMGTEGLEGNKDAQIYPTFSDAVREAMGEELGRFFNDVVFEQNGSFTDLFLADYTFVNQTLADFYGIPSAGGGFAKVQLPEGSGRGGLLTMGAVLASHAHSNESSPIKRGVFVRKRLLCQDLTPPPPDVSTVPPGLDPTLSTRERFAKHTADPSCAGCHQYIDDVGFGFEGFDGVGARRLVENGITVDLSGAVKSMEGFDQNTSDPFSDVTGLSALLVDSPRAQECLPRQYFRFARGYKENAYDECAVHNLALRFTNSELSLQELLIAVTGLPTFTQRTL